MFQVNAVKFCATGKSGLGHLRRVCNIATQLRVLAPRTDAILVTNAPVAGLSETETALFTRIHVCPRQKMASVLASEVEGPIVIDTAVIPNLETLEGPLCLILRETVHEKLEAFRLNYGRSWRSVIVPSPQNHWQVDAACIRADRIDYVGWIYRAPVSATRTLPAASSSRSTLLVGTGGGGNSETARALSWEVDAILAQLRQLIDVEVIHAAGPRLPLEGRLKNADVQLDVGSKLNVAFAEADAVISTVGYNSVLELAAVTTPTLLVPIARTFDDQMARASTWGPRLGRAHLPGTVDESASWLAGILGARVRRPPVDLGEGADSRAAEIILGLFHENDRRVFRKPQSNHVHGHLYADVTAKLRAAGARILPAIYDETKNTVAMPFVAGHDGRQRAETGSVTGVLCDCIDQLALFHAAGHQLAHVNLPSFNPLAKVTPRIATCPYPEIAWAASQLVFRTQFETAREADDHAGQCTIVHGDYHAGQVVFPDDQSAPFIVDLDDMAMGRAEADIGNFIAHAATSPSVAGATVEQSLDPYLALLTERYAQARRERPPDFNLVRLYASLALVRRALKLAGLYQCRERCAVILAAADKQISRVSELAPAGSSEKTANYFNASAGMASL